MRKSAAILLFFISSVACAQPSPAYNLQFEQLAQRWDEAMPLGNGMLGALIWQKQGRLRLSLDRADLWDKRKALDLAKFSFKDVARWLHNNTYDSAHQLGDAPYDNIVYPTKLPAAAIEFKIASLGKVVSNTLDIRTALNTVKFENGVVFDCYIHATANIGYFAFDKLPAGIDVAALVPQLVVYNYANNKKADDDNTHAGEGLQKLGYTKGAVISGANSISYRQPTYDHHYFEVKVQWKRFSANRIIGTWVIESDKPAVQPVLNPASKEPTGWDTHTTWWKKFWAQSSVSLPDKLIEKQYYLELYKLGAVARKGAPAITLQAVWTADNGNLPPWKGDFHNDLNTQLSYWPTYTGNHLAEAATYTDWLWKIRKKNKIYAKQYFGVNGLNVPGVLTLNGDPMGGWIQYSLSPTVGAWCAQHFYWQWKYTMDEKFLSAQAYPYIQEAATALEKITYLKNSVRMLPLSSSPEIHDNSTRAWFTSWTNYDLSLAKFLFIAAGETAAAMGKKDEAAHWQTVLKQLPAYDINATGFTIAPGQDLTESHRHLSPYMAIYPLGLLDDNNPGDKIVIDQSLKHIEEKGTRAWCGYSFSWMASLYARAHQADSAAKQLQIFAANFCSVNSFHLNGDQKGGQYSGFTYRPFTLEGNLAFAEGVHELLLQSKFGYIEVFPAVPAGWANVSFKNLRTEGAFLVSAAKENGVPVTVKVFAEKGGMLHIKLPFRTWLSKSLDRSAFKTDVKGIVSVSLRKGQTVVFENGYE